MRSLCPLILAVPGVLVACDDANRTVPDGPPPDMSAPTTITITTGVPAALVVFRDGVTGAWKPAAMTTPTIFEAQVHGPYLVTVVCDDTFTTPGGTFHSWDTWQTGRTLDDPHAYATCRAPAERHAITGHMTQAGAVVMGDSLASSAAVGWDFRLSVANGIYDLIATTSDGLLVQRGIDVGGDLALATIDVATQGTAYATGAFTATNVVASETLKTTVFLETGTNSQPAILYNGAAGTAKIAPTAALRDSDLQTVSVRAFSTTAHGTALRALRRPFRAGGDTSYTLPAALGNPQWTVTGTQAAVSWTQLSVIGNLDEVISGSVAGGAVSASTELDLTTSFVALTAPTKAILDTDIPGFKPEWRVDTAAAYTRQLTIQRIASGEITSLTLSDSL